MANILMRLVFRLDAMNLLHINPLLDQLCTEKFAIIDNFLAEEAYVALLQFMHSLNNNVDFREAHIGNQRSMTRNTTIRSDKTLWIDDALEENSVMQPYLSAIYTLIKIFNQHLFTNLKGWEGHFAIYKPGDFYRKHVDQFRTNKDRQLSCLYYLNDPWEIENGGELVLYNDSDEVLSRILPKGNRFVCFRSELPHEVLPCFLRNRYSISAWLKSSNTGNLEQEIARFA